VGSCSAANDLWYSSWAMVELIEAASRTGQPEHAEPALEQLAERADASGTDWALAVQARCRALLSGVDDAEALYREAIERLMSTPVQLDLARARLLYGEWLRRQSRRVDARMLSPSGRASSCKRSASISDDGPWTRSGN
jgi:hypothetical protein